MGYLPLTEVAELTSINACLTGSTMDNMQKKTLHDLGAKFPMPPAGSVCPGFHWPMVFINPGVYNASWTHASPCGTSRRRGEGPDDTAR